MIEPTFKGIVDSKMKILSFYNLTFLFEVKTFKVMKQKMWKKCDFLIIFIAIEITCLKIYCIERKI